MTRVDIGKATRWVVSFILQFEHSSDPVRDIIAERRPDVMEWLVANCPQAVLAYDSFDMYASSTVHDIWVPLWIEFDDDDQAVVFRLTFGSVNLVVP